MGITSKTAYLYYTKCELQSININDKILDIVYNYELYNFGRR